MELVSNMGWRTYLTKYISKRDTVQKVKLDQSQSAKEESIVMVADDNATHTVNEFSKTEKVNKVKVWL